MIRITLKGLAARPLRTALTTLAIVLGVAMVCGSFVVTDTMRGASESLSSASYGGTDAVVSARTAFAVDSNDDWAVRKPTVDAAALERVRGVPGVKVATGDITDEAKIVGRDGKPLGDGPYFGVGLDARTPGFERLTPFRLDGGRWAAGPGEVVIDASSAEKADYAVGDRIRVTTRGKADAYEVVGIARFGEVKSLGMATAAVFDLRTAQDLFNKDGFDSILVAGRDGLPAAGVRRSLSETLGSTAQVQTAAAHDRFTLDGLDQFIGIIRIALLAFGGVAILVGAFTIFNTLSITVAQRTRELGLLRMVGAGRRQVLGTVLAEALTLGLLASALGLAVGLGLAKGIEAVFTSFELELPEAGTVFATRTVIVSVLVGTLVTVAAGLVPALRATRVAPVAALRDAGAGDRRLRLPGRSVRAIVGLVGRLGGIVYPGASAGLLARRNAMRHPGRTLATAGALTIGVALVTLVTVVAQGLQDTASGSLDRRIAATHVVVGADGWSPVDAQAERAVAAAKGVDAVSSVRQDAGKTFGDVEVVNAVDPATIGRVFSFDYAKGSDATLSGLGRDDAVVDEGWASEHGLTVGERFVLTSASGRDLDLVVRGIEESPVIDPLAFGPITISRVAFDGAFGADRNLLTLVAAGGADDVGLERALAAFPDSKVLGKQAYVDQVLDDVSSLLAIFYVLLALAVVVSLFGIVNALVLATFERTRELGMLRAVGMTRRQVRRMVRHEGVITALLGAGLGMVLGLGLAAIVTSVFAEEGLAFAVPAGALVAFTVVAVVAGVLAAVLPARRAARLDVLTALAYE
jgi:putative ABC transport system permease protein